MACLECERLKMAEEAAAHKYVEAQTALDQYVQSIITISPEFYALKQQYRYAEKERDSARRARVEHSRVHI